jgi:hypothetical protein
MTQFSAWLPGAPVSRKLSQLGSFSVTDPALAGDAPNMASETAKAAKSIRKDRVMAWLSSTKSPCTTAGDSSLARRRLGED